MVLIPLILLFPPLFTSQVNTISFWGIVKSGDITDEFYESSYEFGDIFCKDYQAHAEY